LRGVLRLCLLLIGRRGKKRIQEGLLLVLFRGAAVGNRNVRVLLFLLCLDDFGARRADVCGGNAEAVKDAVDLAGVLCTDKHIGVAVVCCLVLQNAIQDAVFLCLTAELFKVSVANGKDLEFLSAAEHTVEPGFTPCFFLVLQHRIKQHRQTLSGLPTDFCSHLNAVECHPHDLLGCFS